ncbi:MAG: PQQ-dependent sugar dehydrogenase, partial [Bacteriovorax sp.]|nr:PQQ-dependent sugar dehydrogenase [Bacteriovorax sp.]
VEVFAKDLEAPRIMVEDDEENIYVSIPNTGEILLLKDANHDGFADDKQIFLKGYENVHGMAIDGGKLYFIALKKVYVVDLLDKTKVKILIDNLPDVGLHENRTLAIGPDHMLYISIPSNCNSCVDPNQLLATIQKVKLDGLGMTTFAKGLRNTLGFDWHPETHELFGMDQGTDWRGDEIPREELNHIVEGKNYGWPYCWNRLHPDTFLLRNPKGSTKEAFCKTTEAPALTYDAHTTPIGFTFYNSSMFPKSKGSAFVAFHGSWNRKIPKGYKVSKLIFKNGKPIKFENFMSGFLNNKKHSQFGRPAGLLILKDGSLLVSDDSAGVIYRVFYDNTP